MNQESFRPSDRILCMQNVGAKHTARKRGTVISQCYRSMYLVRFDSDVGGLNKQKDEILQKVVPSARVRCRKGAVLFVHANQIILTDRFYRGTVIVGKRGTNWEGIQLVVTKIQDDALISAVYAKDFEWPDKQAHTWTCMSLDPKNFYSYKKIKEET